MTFWVGSTGARLSLMSPQMVTHMIAGQMPRCKNEPSTGTVVGSNGINPNRSKRFVGSGAERSSIQPRNGACRISTVTNITLRSEPCTRIRIVMYRPQSRFRESAQGDKWSFCLTAGKIGPRIRREHEQETAPEPHIGL